MLSLKKLWACTQVAGLAIGASAAHATLPTYDAIYVFGDSYCDVGNIYVATKGLIPPTPYYNGRFSNGPIWVEHVAGALGLSLRPSELGGTDYAFGGAWATAPVSTPEGDIPDVPAQVELYLSKHHGKADPKALYIIEGGGNDILGALPGTNSAAAKELGSRIAASLSEAELLLRRAGAKHFLIPNLFNVGLVPAAQAHATFADEASAATDAYLTEYLAAESLIEGVRIQRVDVFALLNAIKKDTAHFGFADVVKACLDPATYAVCSDPDHTFFWDDEHPTEFGHSFFAVGTITALSE
jgi:outer membrane lipase/esterase